MKENDFNLDTTVQEKKVFLIRIGGSFGAALFLTGVTSLVGIIAAVIGIGNGIWLKTGWASFVWDLLLTAIMILIFVSLVKIMVDGKPFSGTLTWSIRIIGKALTIASFTIPRLQGYHSSGFDLFSRGDFVLIDGAILIPGLLLVILGDVIMAGFHMQREMDEIL